MPPSSLYCCHRSVSRISAAARKRRMATSPIVMMPMRSEASALLASKEPAERAAPATPRPFEEGAALDAGFGWRLGAGWLSVWFGRQNRDEGFFCHVDSSLFRNDCRQSRQPGFGFPQNEGRLF